MRLALRSQKRKRISTERVVNERGNLNDASNAHAALETGEACSVESRGFRRSQSSRTVAL